MPTKSVQELLADNNAEHKALTQAAMDNTKVAYRAAKNESQNIHLPISTRMEAYARAKALGAEWRRMRDFRDSL